MTDTPEKRTSIDPNMPMQIEKAANGGWLLRQSESSYTHGNFFAFTSAGDMLDALTAALIERPDPVDFPAPYQWNTEEIKRALVGRGTIIPPFRMGLVSEEIAEAVMGAHEREMARAIAMRNAGGRTDEMPAAVTREEWASRRKAPGVDGSDEGPPGRE